MSARYETVYLVGLSFRPSKLDKVTFLSALGRGGGGKAVWSTLKPFLSEWIPEWGSWDRQDPTARDFSEAHAEKDKLPQRGGVSQKGSGALSLEP